MERSDIFQYSYEQMNKDLQKLEQSYPGRISLDVAAFSADGRKITEILLGRTDAKHHILIQASMHGREYMNTALVMRQTEDYLKLAEMETYKGVLWKDLYKDICFHVIPMVNPDGVTICQEGPDGIRNPGLRRGIMEYYRKSGEYDSRNIKRWKANARGVDINRNFDADWGKYEGPCKPSSEGFKGAFPESEEETRVILNIAEKSEIRCCIAYHSSGNLIYWDYGSKERVFEADRRLAEAAGRITGYPLVSTVQDGTDAAGCSDYFVRNLGIPAVTIENGSSDCPLPESEYESIYKRNRDLWPGIAYLFAEKILP